MIVVISERTEIEVARGAHPAASRSAIILPTAPFSRFSNCGQSRAANALSHAQYRLTDIARALQLKLYRYVTVPPSPFADLVALLFQARCLSAVLICAYPIYGYGGSHTEICRVIGRCKVVEHYHHSRGCCPHHASQLLRIRSKYSIQEPIQGVLKEKEYMIK